MKNEIKRTGTARKVGRPRAYTPEALEAKFEEYVEWAKENPIYINPQIRNRPHKMTQRSKR